MSTRTLHAATIDGSERRRPDALPVALGAAIIVAVFAAFLPALFAEFLSWDDADVLLSNTQYHGFTADNIRGMFSSTINGHWMPLTWMSYALDHALWGMNPRGYHLTNIVIHAINSVLVYGLALRLIALARGSAGVAPTREHVAAAFAGLFFAIHPLRVESVAWVTERRDVLSAMFLFAAALAYLRSGEPGKPGLRSVAAYTLAIVLLALSLLGKAWGMSFFVVALAMDWYPLRRLPFDPRRWLTGDAIRVILQKLPFALLGLCVLSMANIAVHAVMAPKPLAEWGILERCVQAAYGLFFYIRASVVPMNLSPLYELPTNLNPLEPRYIAAYVFLIAAAVVLWVKRHRWPALVAAMGVYCVVVAPVLGFNQSGEQFVADRYSYLACVGLVIVAAGWLLGVHERIVAGKAGSRWMLPAAGCVLGACLMALTFSQTTVWRDTFSLWAHAHSVTPTPTVNVNLALQLIDRGRSAEAIPLLESAVVVRDKDGRGWFTLGNEYKKLGRFADAEKAYRNTIEKSPMKYVGWVNLGSLYINQLNRPREAIECFREAIKDIEQGEQRRHLSAKPYLALGDALRRTGDVEGARAAFTKALEFDETREQAAKDLATLAK